MPEKPTYEELEQRVKDLERENLALLKRDSAVESELPPEDIDLKSIINVQEIQSILDDFHYLTNMVTAILDTNGEVIESTGWQDLCTRFHRAHPETAHNCTKSDLYLAKNLKPGEYVDYKCQNGLWDVVTPLYVGTKHLGNIFTGQFFYDDEKVDESFFIKQAEKYGFDKESYLDAFRRIPRYSKDTIAHLMSFLVKLTTYISKISLFNIKLEKEINERKQAETALLESERKYQMLFNTLPIGLALCKANGDLVDVNPAYAKIIGQSVEEILKLSYWDITPKAYEEQEKKQLECLEKTKRYGPYEKEYIHKDGHLVPVRLLGQQIEQNGEKLIWSSVENITNQRKLEQQIRNSQKMESIGNLAGGIAHDFNNILFPIIGRSEMLLEDLPEGSFENENAQEIYQAAKRAGDLVNQILTFSRQSEHRMTPVRLQDILKEVLKLSRSTIPINIEINENIQHDCGLVLADPTQIHQIAMNLITNAFHAVEDKNGTINIKLEERTLQESELDGREKKPGPYVSLSVSDNGVGMSQSTINNIFEPYFTTKKQGKGTGLGLAVVYGIVKEHDGHIEVSSEIGKGSTFNIYLPSMEKSSNGIVVDRIPKTAIGNERILLVDDEVSIAKLEGQVLSRLGYQVTVKTDSEDALHTFKSNPDSFDLVISDMTMPNMTGDQLAKEILSMKPDTPIIICTGFSERIKQAEIIGVKGFLMKPVIKSDLAQMIRNVLDETIEK